MIFALLFILTFLLGLVLYLLTNRWLVAVLVCIALFVLNTLLDTDARADWGMTFIFGLPIVFVASLLGAYVVEWRRSADTELDQAETLDET